MDQYVRLQRLERGLPWFHRELDSLLQQRMNADLQPMRPFFDVHDRESQQSNRYGAGQDMFTAWQRVSDLGQVGYSQDTFDRMMQYTDQFPTTRVEGYAATAEQVAHQMGTLYAFVQQIDRSCWPAHAPENPPFTS